ncbi:MAG: GNAT family N-acetyltransferase [Kofleriaceae bacterium]
MTSLQLLDAHDPQVQPIWSGLEAVAAPSFFLSWGWIENWLAALPPEHAPQLAVIRNGDQPVAAFFTGKRRIHRRGVVPSTALYLNATGNERCDDVCLEHNGLLRDPRSGVSLETVLDHLPGGWDELFLPAVDRTDASIFDRLHQLDRRGLRVRVDKELAVPFVDLELVRAASAGYLSMLTPQMRTQIRRTQREVGEVELEVARDHTHALDIYRELLQLHTKRAHALGKPGTFSDAFHECVHRRLIETQHPHGAIQLLRLTASGVTLGCLYNFVYRGRVLCYQAGFEQFEDKHIQPSSLCHALAIEHNAAAGAAIYDLLADPGRGHRALATGVTHLVWLRVQRKLARFGIEHRLERLKHALTSWRGRGIADEVPFGA